MHGGREALNDELLPISGGIMRDLTIVVGVVLLTRSAWLFWRWKRGSFKSFDSFWAAVMSLLISASVLLSLIPSVIALRWGFLGLAVVLMFVERYPARNSPSV